MSRLAPHHLGVQYRSRSPPGQSQAVSRKRAELNGPVGRHAYSRAHPIRPANWKKKQYLGAYDHNIHKGPSSPTATQPPLEVGRYSRGPRRTSSRRTSSQARASMDPEHPEPEPEPEIRSRSLPEEAVQEYAEPPTTEDIPACPGETSVDPGRFVFLEMLSSESHTHVSLLLTC